MSTAKTLINEEPPLWEPDFANSNGAGGSYTGDIEEYIFDIRWSVGEGSHPPNGLVDHENAMVQRQHVDETIDMAGDSVATDPQDDWSSLDAAIETLNRDYAAVNEGGKFQIMKTVYDPIFERKKLERISAESFRQMYSNVPVSIEINADENKKEIVTKTAAAWWMADVRRRQYLGGVIFDPTGKAHKKYLNLWQGWPVAPKAGDWSLMRQHIRDVLCSGDGELDAYLMGWLARMFQQPDKPGEVAIVFRGKKGSGKGTLGNWLNVLWGQHGIRISDPKHLIGNFNAHMRDCCYVFCDEAFFASDRQQDGILKALVTEPLIFVEAKHQNAIQCKNMLHILMASNSNFVVPATEDERRYFVVDVSSSKIKDREYFSALQRQMENGGAAAMLHDLLEMDITGFDHRDVPATDALNDQKLLNLDSFEKWWMAVLSRGYAWKSRHGADIFANWDTFVSTQLLGHSYRQWCFENKVTAIRDDSQLGKYMGRLYDQVRPAGLYPVYEIDVIDHELKKPAQMKERPNGYAVGDIYSAREKFVAKIGVNIQWEADLAA